MTNVQKKNKAKIHTPNHRAEKYADASGGLNKRYIDSAIKNDPPAINGRLLPNEVLIRSEMYPMAGSVMASKIRTLNRI